MDMVLRRSIQNSELVVEKEKRAFLTYSADGLADCSLFETEEGVDFLFEQENLQPSKDVMSKSYEEQLRYLINCAELEELALEYDFSLSLDNLMVDLNLCPRVLIRDAVSSDRVSFLSRYLALIGSMLQRRYTYDDYLNGGYDLYRKNKLLMKLSKLESAIEVRDNLLQEYHKISEKTRNTKRLVPKRYVRLCVVLVPLMAVALILMAILEWQVLFYEIPYKDSVIEANSAYLAGNYIAAQNALGQYPLDDFAYETKFLLSRAYVITEALTDSQKENVLTGLTLKTDAVLFDYWISVGRLEFDSAIDIAQRLGDDELLLFAYMKYEVYVKNDTSLTGEEKVAMISDFENKISILSKNREEVTSS